LPRTVVPAILQSLPDAQPLLSDSPVKAPADDENANEIKSVPGESLSSGWASGSDWRMAGTTVRGNSFEAISASGSASGTETLVVSEAGTTCAGATEEEAREASTNKAVRNDTDIQTNSSCGDRRAREEGRKRALQKIPANPIPVCVAFRTRFGRLERPSLCNCYLLFIMA
jgi:hypothetical protein